MFPLPRFDYVSPRSVEEACFLLQKHAGAIKVLAGGTELLPSMKQGSTHPDHLLDLKRIHGLDRINESPEGEVVIGSLAALSALAQSPLIQRYFPGLAQAADSVATPQIRNMATIGGNVALNTRCWYFNQSQQWLMSFESCFKRGGRVCHAVPGGKTCFAYCAGDTIPLLVALGAFVTVRTSEGESRRLIESLYTHEGTAPLNLSSSALITEVCVPIPKGTSGSSYKKLSLRRAIDFPLASCAVSITMDGTICRTIRIVLGAVGPGPIIIHEAQDLAGRRPLSDNVIEELAALSPRYARPVTNTGMSPGYRRAMTALLTKAALRDALIHAEKQR